MENTADSRDDLFSNRSLCTEIYARAKSHEGPRKSDNTMFTKRQRHNKGTALKGEVSTVIRGHRDVLSRKTRTFDLTCTN